MLEEEVKILILFNLYYVTKEDRRSLEARTSNLRKLTWALNQRTKKLS